jgi:hypothetical protein
MRSIETHVIETGQDVDIALKIGLLEVTDLDITECSSCSDPVGHTKDGFVSFTVSLDDTDVPWFNCTGCATPIIDPDSAAGTTSYEGLFDSQEEFDEFTFDED